MVYNWTCFQHTMAAAQKSSKNPTRTCMKTHSSHMAAFICTVWLSCSGSFWYIWYCTWHNRGTLHSNQRGYLRAFSLFRSQPAPSLCSLLQRWHLNRGMQRLLLERGRCGDTRVVRVTHSSHPHLDTHMPRTRAHRTHCARTNTTLPVGKHNHFFPCLKSDATHPAVARLQLTSA